VVAEVIAEMGVKDFMKNCQGIKARAMVYWLRQTDHDQELMGSNPGSVYWMPSYYINTQK
jgi:hypothetical protein